MKRLKKISHWFSRREHFGYVLVFLLAVILFSALQASPSFVDPDSFYHAKIAQLMAERGIIHEFPWLSATTLKFGFVDHHFLYHLLLLPFVVLMPPLAGLKLATILFASLAIVAVYWFLRQQQIKGAIWYALFLMTVNPFIFRISLAKAPALALSLMFLIIYFIFNRRYLYLVIASYLYVWLYGGWPMAIGLSLIYTFLSFVWPTAWRGWVAAKLGKLRVLRQNLLSLVYILLGAGAGILFFPYFPDNLKFYWQQTFKIAIVNYQQVIAVGGEWYPYLFKDLVVAALPFSVLLFLSLVGFIIFLRKQTINSWFFLILTAVFFVLTLKSRRYVEYFIPLGVVFCALSINPYLDKIKKFLRTILPAKAVAIFPLILFATFSTFFFHDIASVKRDFQNGLSFNKFAAVAEWLKQNAGVGDIVFHSDWDEFPLLFYHNDQNYYLVGLDPTFMYEYNKKMYQQWVNITTGQPADNLQYIVGQVFGAKYVFIDAADNQAMARNFENNIYFTKVYEDREAKIFKVEK
jgi:hypothetical protein